MKENKLPFKFFFLLGLLGILIYSNAAFIQFFYFDDDLTILENPAITDIKNLKSIYQTFNSRFLVGITFALNYLMNDFNPVGYRLVNIVIHIIFSFLVYYFVFLIFKTPQMKKSKLAAWSDFISLPCALIFLVHPLATEAVIYITQRFMLLASFFYLLALILYIKSRLRFSLWNYGGSLGATVMAMYCKETAVTIPFMVLLIELYFFAPFSVETKKRIKILVPFFLTLFIIPLTLLTTPQTAIGTTRIVALSNDTNNVDITKAAGPYKRQEYFLTQLNVLMTYLRLFVYPVNQNIDYDYPIVKEFNFKTILSAIVLLMIFYLAFKLFSTERLISFAIIWFFLTLSVESSVIPIAHVISEYRLYLALVGLSMLASVVFFYIFQNKKRYVLAVTIIIFILSFLTYHRNKVWQSPLRLWEDAVQKSPQKPRPNINLGKIYTEQRRFEEAIYHFLAAIDSDFKNATAYTNLGVVYVKQGNLKEAISAHQEAIRLNPRYRLAYLNLGAAYYKLGDRQKEIDTYIKALEIFPDSADIIFLLAQSYYDMGNYKAVIQQREKLKNLGQWKLVEELNILLDKAGQ